MNRRVFYFLTAGVTYLLALTMVGGRRERPRAGPGSASFSHHDQRSSLTRAGAGLDGAGGLRRRGDVPDLSRGSVLQGHEARVGVQRAHTGGHARLRELPRPRPEARRERRSRADQQLQARSAPEASDDVHDVPQPRRRTRCGTAASTISGTSAARPATACTRRRAPSQLKAETVTEQCATCHRNVDEQAAPLQPHAGAGGRADVLVVPQRARQHERQAAARRARRSTRAAPAVTPTSADRICGSTRRSVRAASRVTTRTGRTTIGCWSASCRFSASAVTSRRAIPRRSMTGSC